MVPDTTTAIPARAATSSEADPGRSARRSNRMALWRPSGVCPEPEFVIGLIGAQGGELPGQCRGVGRQYTGVVGGADRLGEQHVQPVGSPDAAGAGWCRVWAVRAGR